MGEYFEQPSQKPKSEAAKAVEHIQSSGNLLSTDAKHLADMHPLVSQIVDTDTKSEDFGRIKDAETAEAMAEHQDVIRDKVVEEKAEQAAYFGQPVGSLDTEQKDIARRSNAELDMDFSSSLYKDARNNNPLATVEEAAEIARKVATDYQITQGNAEAIGRRSFDIYRDVANNGLGREGAIAALNDASRRAAEDDESHRVAS